MSEKKSKFSGIFTSRQNEEEAVVPRPTLDVADPVSEEFRPSPALTVVQAPEPAPRAKAKPRDRAPEVPRPVGRPRGKRSDGDHVQVTAYIRRDTHFSVKTALLSEQKGRDFSELVEELLAKWVKTRT